MTAPDLFDRRERVIETAGDTLAVIERIKAEGGFVWMMENIRGSNAGWRLSIFWPEPSPSPA
jgi:hypothetical protein